MTTLSGAYWARAHAAEQRGLVLRLFPEGTLRGREGARGLGLRGFIEAEGLSVKAPLTGLFTVAALRPRLVLSFASDDGELQSLVLSLSPEVVRPTLRSLTALSGGLSSRGGVWAGAEVRLDWRRLITIES